MSATQYSIPAVGGNQDLDLPSGGKVQVRMLEIEDLIRMGILDIMDTLGSIVQTDHIDRVKGTNKPTDRPNKKPTKAEQAKIDVKDEEDSNEAVFKMMKDKSKFDSLTQAIDRVIAMAILQPPVSLAYEQTTQLVDGAEKIVLRKHTPQDQSERDSGSLWTDQVQFTDKMHIFGVVLPGGEDLKKFRQGSQQALGDLDDVSEAEDTTE